MSFDKKLKVEFETAAPNLIETILDYISLRIDCQESEDTLEKSFIIIWNITNESLSNCDLFLKHDGLELFMKCYKSYWINETLIRNILGIIYNISEVEHFRSKLMCDEIIRSFM